MLNTLCFRLLLLFMAIGGILSAQSPEVFYYPDTESGLTYADAQAAFEAGNFQLIDSADVIQPRKGVFWLSFRLENASPRPDSLILYLGQEHDVRIYGLDAEKRIGTLVPGNKKKGALPGGFLLRESGYSSQVLIPMEAGETIQLFIKGRRLLQKPFPVDLRVFSPAEWNQQTDPGRRDFGQGLFQGVLFALLLYHLLLFLMLRDRVYLFYAAYVFCIELITIGYFGYLHQWVFPNAPGVAQFFIQLAQFSVIPVAFLFMQRFVNLSRIHPWWDHQVSRIIRAMLIYYGLVLLIFFVFREYRVVHYSYFLGIPIILFGGYFCFVLWRTRATVARYYAIATAVLAIILLASFLITFMDYYGLIEERSNQRFYMGQIAVVAHLLTFALGLGYRRREKDLNLQRVTELDEIKSRFFTNISHEFRTPLTLIMGPLQRLQTEESNPKKLQVYQSMDQNSRRLLKLINELLNLSELDSGKMRLAPQRINLIDFVRAFGLSFESLAHIRKIDLRLDTPSKPLMAWVDPDKLEKILANLLSNAFKFTPEGGVITLSLELTGPEEVTIAVRDTGPGIPKEIASKIFDRFFYVSQKDPKTEVSTGIGLALTKELVSLHGGEISVESQPGHGACFRFTLPLDEKKLEGLPSPKAAERPVPKPALASASVSAESGMTTSETLPEDSPRVLLVEDNPEVRVFILSYLVDHYPVIEATDGQEGLQLATEQIPDIIISDVMMPNMDGNEMCRQLKDDERTSHIPIILLTALGAKQNKLQGLDIGADVYLTKPFDADELLAHIANLLANRKRLLSRFQAGTLLEPDTPELPERDRQFLDKVNAAIEEHLDDDQFGVDQLLKELAMSRTQLHRKLKALTDQSTTQYVRGVRLEHGRRLLQTGDYNVTEVAFRVGFNSQTYFSRSFKEYFGYAPSEL
jgi:signal transduction histidine kinase/DNA-binding response OmpR family regulator